MIPLQQPPEGHGVGLDAVGAGDHQNGAVQNGQAPLRFRGKVYMAGGVHQSDVPPGGGEPGLLGENGDAPGPLQIVGVQVGIAVIHPAQSPPGAGGIEQSLGKGSLARVHMGQ